MALTPLGLMQPQSLQQNQVKHPDSMDDFQTKNIKFLQYRQKILSENLANLNTPGYLAKDAKLLENFGDLINKSGNTKLPLKRTSQKHLNAGDIEESNFTSYLIKDSYEVKPNGNNVSLQQQMMKVSQNNISHNAALKIYEQLNNLFSIIIKKQ